MSPVPAKNARPAAVAVIAALVVNTAAAAVAVEIVAVATKSRV